MARPGVQCTFDVMDLCKNSIADAHQRNLCVEGARDAHLMHTGSVRLTAKDMEHYDVGYFNTQFWCTSDYVHHRHYRTYDPHLLSPSNCCS